MEVSHDGGVTWSSRSVGVTGTSVWTVAADPSQPDTAWATTYSTSGGPAQVIRTEDGGSTWTVLLTAFASTVITSIAFDPFEANVIYATRARVLPVRGDVLISTDRGAHWRFLSRAGGEDPTRILADPVRPGTLYLSEDAKAVHRSTDGGRTWQPYRAGIASTAVTDLAVGAEGSMLYAAGCDSTLFAAAGAVYQRILP
jgi:photosystem II stability/assembly factor-like uncharacterized protein